MWALDPALAPVPFDSSVLSATAPLKIGVMRRDRFFEPAAACSRAVDEAVAALRARGHTVVEFDPLEGGADTYQGALLYYALMSADGQLKAFKSGLGGERLHRIYDTLNMLASMPDFLRPLLAGVLGLLGMKRMADIIVAGRGKSAFLLWQYQARRTLFKRAFLQHWTAQGLDLLLTPGLGLPAIPHGTSSKLTVACSYTFLSNILHTPAGTVPVTTVRPDECDYAAPATERDSFFKVARASMQTAAGLPVGVQIVALPFRDELALRGMRELEAGLRMTTGGLNSGNEAAGPSKAALFHGVPPHVLERSLAQAKNVLARK
jgi:fatty acid amide hydrolase